MAVITRGEGASLTRRRFLTTAVSSAAVSGAGSITMPYLSRAADRPRITHGIQSGDVAIDSAVVWARADRPSRMRLEVATSDGFRNIRSAALVDALPETDFAAKALIEGLPVGHEVVYRVRFEDLSSSILSEPQIGRFRTPPPAPRTTYLVYSIHTPTAP